MPIFAYLLREWKFVSQQMGLCVFRAQLRLRTFYIFLNGALEGNDMGENGENKKKIVDFIQLVEKTEKLTADAVQNVEKQPVLLQKKPRSCRKNLKEQLWAQSTRMAMVK